ncbi:MAG: outer membrane protein assembly factor BamA [Rhodospirillales bacterium RIFCSPLOWO2_12_FULL_58_28]|nr:MAG: outer membrane protein assembly factor BamA [Rhodospirillales bacterium RIFCSPLOWO2_02_FULL_58_16]OHC77975.1 MAG: outer membrane protein assembly factor BamA [Rhodospirillales bacterium RIFCSPLOWO2_12_FULL_58_28]
MTQALLFSGAADAQSGGTIRDIIIDGAQRIEPETVRSYLLVQKGDAFDPARIDRSLKSLFATGLFADVTLHRQGDDLVVTLVENPIINRIAFEGNKKLDDETLGSEVSLRPRIIYTRTKVQNDVKRILTLYRRNGRFAATVEPKIIQLPQNRVDLVFEISEGNTTEIRNIRFVGNREFDDSRLREIVRTRETRWYRILSSDDTYDPDRLTLDRELLRRFYLNNGYADFQVVSALAELTPDRKDFFITFTVEEGARYQFGEIGVEARLRNLKADDLLGAVEIEQGDWYNADSLEKTIETLTEEVGAFGYAFVDIRPRINRNRSNHSISVVFEVNEGPRVFVERIDIVGNVRTASKVIRREFRLVEGDAFNSAKMRRSKQRIQDLDFFEKVVVEQVPGSAPDKTLVKVEVEEKSTGSISLGFGFSTTSGPLLEFGFREKNLLGQGQSLGLNVTAAARRSQVDVSFTEPYFLDREISAGVDAFHTSTKQQKESSFDSKATGAGLRAGYPVTENLHQLWRYTGKRSTLANISGNASPIIQLERGSRTLSELSHSLSYDRRDSRLKPTKGHYMRLTNDLAGLGGTTKYIRNSLNAGKYFPLADQWVLSFSGSAGHVYGLGDDVHLLDRFFVGGDNLRGFATSGIGPRDANTKDSLGGEWMYTGTTELTMPLGLPQEMGITGKVFTDIGSSGKMNDMGYRVNDDGSLRLGAGVGIVWASPFGPMGFDLGLPLIKEGYDNTENFRVNFGTSF